jgi:hypothetical protein
VSQNDGKALLLGQAAIGTSDSDKGGKLVFGKYSDRWVLQEVDTATFQFQVKSRLKENALTASKQSVETRSVAVGN